jgi:hypothetical protein
MNIGNQVIYKNQLYWIVSNDLGGLIEIAPTKHGVGSFIVLTEWLEIPVNSEN